jgi:predicted DNA-binding transcriptional regulator YafY
MINAGSTDTAIRREIMRADRLLSLLFLLQAKGRLTAQQIAAELEVSERTVYRDVDALGMAGVPIYTQIGANGGISLDEDYRVSLTGLSRDQVWSLFASREPGPLQDIGLARAQADTLHKLWHSLPDSQQQQVTQVQQRLHIDPLGWFKFGDTSQVLSRLQAAVWGDQQVMFSYQSVSQYEMHPVQVEAYGLVAKADKWYLVGRLMSGEYRTYRLTRMRALEMVPGSFRRDPAFDLAAYWRDSRQRFQQQMRAEFPPYPVTLHLHPEQLPYLDQVLEGCFQQQGEPDGEGWITVDIRFATQLEAQTHVLALGLYARVIAPARLRDHLLACAEALMLHYRTPGAE